MDLKRVRVVVRVEMGCFDADGIGCSSNGEGRLFVFSTMDCTAFGLTVGRFAPCLRELFVKDGIVLGSIVLSFAAGLRMSKFFVEFCIIRLWLACTFRATRATSATDCAGCDSLCRNLPISALFFRHIYLACVLFRFSATMSSSCSRALSTISFFSSALCFCRIPLIKYMASMRFCCMCLGVHL